MHWKLRFRFGYLKKYGWFERFPFGWMIVGLFIYKATGVVYVKKHVDRDALLDSGGNLTEMVYSDAEEELFRATPYDFGYLAIITYMDYEIDYNRYVVLVEGVPRPEKR